MRIGSVDKVWSSVYEKMWPAILEAMELMAKKEK